MVLRVPFITPRTLLHKGTSHEVFVHVSIDNVKHSLPRLMLLYITVSLYFKIKREINGEETGYS